MSSPLGLWQFWALLAAVFAALTAIFAKIGVEEINPDYATLIRTFVILIALSFLLFVTGQLESPASIPRKTWVFLTLSGLATGASWLCYFRALKLGNASRVAPIDKLSVLFVAIFASAFLGERLSLGNWLGIALITVGAILLAVM